VTRAFCELAGGICPGTYRRYRIDDHTHHVFDLIHLLGHTRRVYLPEVVFEHHNATEDAGGGRAYVPDPALHRLDSELFRESIRERRSLALACVERIEGPGAAEERAGRMRRLEALPDSEAVRRREHARWWRSGSGIAGAPVSTRPQGRIRPRSWIENTLAEFASHWPLLQRFGHGIPQELLDPKWYQARYPDVAARGLHPLGHYLRYGGFEGRDPNPHFDSAWYLETNPDVAASGLNPLVHFVRYGAREYRSPNLLFDVRHYESQNPEVARANVNPLAHFITTGLKNERSPLASLTAAQYYRRLETDRYFGQVEISASAELCPLSIVIPTRNRREQLARTVDACLNAGKNFEFEILVIDDGSTDGTSEMLRSLAREAPRLRFESAGAGGPARARNLAAAWARYDVLLFMGDDIVPADGNFLEAHALRHAEHPQADFAVLGKVEWPDDPAVPISFAMAQAVKDGTQFAYSRLTPHAFASWQYFYTANLSVKKALIGDWTRDGFDEGFPAAALEDVELAYRLWRSPQGLRLYYEPQSLGLHYHSYKLANLLERQKVVGKSLRHMLERHPEVVDEYGVRSVAAALRTSPASSPATGGSMAAELEGVTGWILALEAEGTLGSQEWHGALVSAVFELYMHEGYASAWAEQEVNLATAHAVILDRFFSRIGKVGGPGRLTFQLAEMRRRK
jgi:GT2 family glycosyltransferase